jgi:hypothetical protein
MAQYQYERYNIWSITSKVGKVANCLSRARVFNKINKNGVLFENYARRTQYEQRIDKSG